MSFLFWCLLGYTLTSTENVLVEKRQEGSSGIKVLNEKLHLNNGPPTLSKKANRYCLPGLQLRVSESFHPLWFQRFIYYIKTRQSESAALILLIIVKRLILGGLWFHIKLVLVVDLTKDSS